MKLTIPYFLMFVYLKLNVYICNTLLIITIVNSGGIILRLKEVLEHYNLTSSTFADTIDVQRSSISHLLSGRNKPSLDFVMKVVNKFPDVDLYWLLYDEGSFPKKKEERKKVEETITEEISKETKIETPTLFSENTITEPEVRKISNTRFSANDKKLLKVVLLYDDGSFEEYNK
ncbi:DNA-binding XRE family transcriptional regulator [Tenacibaculum adriaticum]|uniref:DNA-binding XRE family transcriptional regulator n=1 Tax=Tenacibaculum adriaticum TaxID=413713 RepID=A0A5S5DU13_9FLAO|nr:helix-turn-helix transcriptional regulator [Tenacibaculum adriaticum]TYP98858.1 DNA-binding XRE family transcriptional regulator [Tenacibaculum adriaticum]